MKSYLTIFVMVAVGALSPPLTTVASSQCFLSTIQGSSSNLNRYHTNRGHLLDGYNEFVFKLLQNLFSLNDTARDDILVSPISIWSVLTVLYLGARNSTETELESVLKYGQLDKAEVIRQLQELNKLYLHQQGSPNSILLENTIYVQDDEPIQEDCINNLLGSELDVIKVNLTQEPELNQIISGINALIDFQTNGRIEELIPLEYLDYNTRLFIVSAASFYGIWQNQFDPRQTRPGKFFIRPNHSTIVEMMTQTNTFAIAKSPSLKCSAVEMTFLDSDVNLIILLPDSDSSDMKDLIGNLNDNSLQSLLGDMKMMSIRLTLPKFHLEQVLELKSILRGTFDVKDVFDSNMSDLFGFSQLPGFHLKDIRHLPFIEFNELGTSQTEEVKTVSRPNENVDLTFAVNRPFVFLITHRTMKRILFVGIVKRPLF